MDGSLCCMLTTRNYRDCLCGASKCLWNANRVHKVNILHWPGQRQPMKAETFRYLRNESRIANGKKVASTNKFDFCWYLLPILFELIKFKQPKIDRQIIININARCIYSNRTQINWITIDFSENHRFIVYIDVSVQFCCCWNFFY